MLINKSVKQFIKELQSESPAPGGGSAAALAGSTGTALAIMAIKITLPKISDEKIKRKLEFAEKELKIIKKYQTELIDKDAKSYNMVIKAFKLPKNTEAKKQKRRGAIQKAYKIAASIPLQTALQALQAFININNIKEFLSKNVASDIEVAELLLNASLKGAIANVRINLACIKDKEYKKKAEKLLNTIMPH